MGRIAGRVTAAAVATLSVALAIPGAGAAIVAPPPHLKAAYQFDVTGTVDPLLAHGLERAVRNAQRSGTPLLLRIDTPGGLDSSMRRIIRAIDAATVPVVCWVGPSGARAASAGAFILIGCPHAVMAPGTNVGAAHPVGLTGDIESQKVLNDAVAYIRSLAERFGRNAAWAESAVRDSVSVTAGEALTLHVVDAIEGARDDIVSGAVTQQRLTLSEAVVHDLVDPNLAFLFFLFGIAGIVAEAIHPGISVPGVLGVLLLVASMLELGMLPVNLGALVLLGAGMAFLVVDLHAHTHGAGTLAGTIALIVGGLFLFDASVPNAHVSKIVIVAASCATAAFFALVLRAALRARRMPARAGGVPAGGTEGVAVSALEPGGIVLVAGEQWSAKSTEPVPQGARVRVVDVQGLTLKVEPSRGEQ